MYSSLEVVTPPAQEPVGVDLVRRHLRVDFEDDTLLTFYAQSAREWVEAFLGRALITTTYKWTVLDAPPPAGFPYISPIAIVLPMWVSWPVFVRRPMELPRQVVRSVASVAWGPFGSVTVRDPSTYMVDGTVPARLQLPGNAALGTGHVEVVFTAGYGDTPDTVPPGICLAILLLTAALYENRGDAGGDMPKAAEALLWPHRIITFGG